MDDENPYQTPKSGESSRPPTTESSRQPTVNHPVESAVVFWIVGVLTLIVAPSAHDFPMEAAYWPDWLRIPSPWRVEMAKYMWLSAAVMIVPACLFGLLHALARWLAPNQR